MAALTMDLDALGQALPLPTDEARTRVRALGDRTLQLAKDIQALSHRLHPPKLEYLGVASASASFCREVSSQQNVDIAFSHDGIPDGLPNHVALSVFRVLQEAVTNAVRHAGVRHVAVTLRGSPEEIRLEIVDAGVGFDRRRRPERPRTRTDRHAGARAPGQRRPGHRVATGRGNVHPRPRAVVRFRSVCRDLTAALNSSSFA